jgi:polysaccharide export outer membrane protein
MGVKRVLFWRKPMIAHRNRLKRELWILTVQVVLTSTLLLGCQSNVSNPSAPETETARSSRVALAPGDVVEIKFYYTPRLNETQTVRPDGKITLQLVGEVEARGLEPAELRDRLLELYAPHLVSPEVAVIVRSFLRRRVFVGGEVKTPRVVEMPEELTVLQAIVQAGGFDMREAEPRNVIVIRHKDGQRYGYSVNLKPALEGKETHPFFLEPEDVVHVPQTQIAKLDQWIDQHINKIVPDTGFFIYRTSGKTTVGMGSYR